MRTVIKTEITATVVWCLLWVAVMASAALSFWQHRVVVGVIDLIVGHVDFYFVIKHIRRVQLYREVEKYGQES